MNWRRLYRLALRTLPADLRLKHGRAMEDLFARELARARGQGCLRGALAGVAGVWDAVRIGLYERGRAAIGRALGNRRKRREHEREGKRDMYGFLDDLEHGTRSLRRAPAFTLASVLILALGIGTSTAVFTGYRAVVLEELPVTDPDRIISLSLQRHPTGSISLIAEEIEALRRESRTLLDVAGVGSFEAEPLTEGGRSVVLKPSRVTANFFQVLGARPVLGRLLRPEDGDEGAGNVAVISYETWQREFGGDPGVLGRRLIRTDSQDSYSIVGVASPGLDYPIGADYWIPSRSRDAVAVLGRLAPDVTAEAARSEFLSIARLLDESRSNPRAPTGATAQPLSESVLGGAKPILTAIVAAVGLLLLIACVNVGNLLIMRAAQRSGNVLVRRALGATTGRIARLFLIEGALLAAAGGILGLIIASGLLQVLPNLAPPGLPRMEMIALSGTPVAVATAVTLLAILLIGAAPALAAAKGDLASALRTNGRSAPATRGRRRVRQSLVAAQVALAVVLLVGAGLLVRTLQRLGDLELGYDTKGVAIVELGFNRQAREGGAETFALLEGVLERVRAVHGVTAASPIMSRPFVGGAGIFQARPMPEEQSETEAKANPAVPLEVGGEQLFRTLGIPIIRGRGLLDTDREGAPRVAVVSQAVARHLWPGRDPIGRRIRLVTSDAHWWTVVGVAGDTRFRQLREPTPTIYVHYRQLHILPWIWTVALRTEQPPASVLPAMRRLVDEFDPRVNVWRVGTLGGHLAHGPLAQPRTSAILLSIFGLAALLLAAAGLYVVMALAVRERTHELGVRQALGASPARLRREVLGEAAAVTGVGAVVGLGGALLASRLLVALLFGIGPADPATLLGACATLLTVAAVAAYPAARRATRVEPMRALRHG